MEKLVMEKFENEFTRLTEVITNYQEFVSNRETIVINQNNHIKSLYEKIELLAAEIRSFRRDEKNSDEVTIINQNNRIDTLDEKIDLLTAEIKSFHRDERSFTETTVISQNNRITNLDEKIELLAAEIRNYRRDERSLTETTVISQNKRIDTLDEKIDFLLTEIRNYRDGRGSTEIVVVNQINEKIELLKGELKNHHRDFRSLIEVILIDAIVENQTKQFEAFYYRLNELIVNNYHDLRRTIDITVRNSGTIDIESITRNQSNLSEILYQRLNQSFNEAMLNYFQEFRSSIENRVKAQSGQFIGFTKLFENLYQEIESLKVKMTEQIEIVLNGSFQVVDEEIVKQKSLLASFDQESEDSVRLLE